MKKYEIKLTIEELKLIDGKVSEEVQKVIDEAHKENSYGFDLPLMNEILKEAEERGTLTWRNKQISSCKYCDKVRDYYRYPRGGRYHNKGDKNYDKPKYYSGIKFHEGLVTVQGSGDMCTDCADKFNLKHTLIDYVLDNDLKIEIQNNDYRDSKYLKDDIQICYNCESEMLTSEMGKSMTAMGDGAYPSTCPNCGTESRPFGKSHKSTSKFKHRLNPLHTKEIQDIKREVKLHNESVENDDDKILLSRNKNNENIFYIKETKFSNGYATVLKFDIKKKEYYVGYRWEDKATQFIEKLEGYTQTKNEFFDFI